MRIADLYPAHLEHSPDGFNAIMRSILIQASYDGTLKKITGFKGLFVDEAAQECWTLKFEQFAGVFGLILVGLGEGYGHFNLYYFPAPHEALVDKLSLVEACMAQETGFIDKVRAFGRHTSLLMHFRVASLRLYVHAPDQGIFILYESQIRERVYARDGVVHPARKGKMLIDAGGLDKDFPAFRLLLPFMHFLNTAISKITREGPGYFELFRAKGSCRGYDGQGGFHDVVDAGSVRLLIATGYGELDFKALCLPVVQASRARKVDESTTLNAFFRKAPWYELDANNRFSSSGLPAAASRPRLIVVTGFLGSGKTSLLQHYIEYETEKNRFVGIIQNEIGTTGLDGRLLDYDYSLVEMDEGCVCCSLSGQLRAGIHALTTKTVPDTILLETTGVANPFNLLSELNELDDLVDFEAIVTVVDGTSALELFDQYRIFQDQIRAADVILLNKSDLLNEIELNAVHALLSANNRCAAILPTIGCNIHPNTLHQSLVASTSQIASLVAEAETPKHDHVGEGISSIKIDIPKPLEKAVFRDYLDRLPKRIFRVKGIVRFEGEMNPWVVQYVNGRHELLEQQHQNLSETFLVYIGKDMEGAYLESPN